MHEFSFLTLYPYTATPKTQHTSSLKLNSLNMKAQYILGASSTILFALVGISSALPTPLSTASKVGDVPSFIPRLKERDNLIERDEALQNTNLARVRSPSPIVNPSVVMERDVDQAVEKRGLGSWIKGNGWHGNKGAAGSSPDASAAPAKRGLGSWIKGNGWHGNKGAAAASPDASAAPAKRGLGSWLKGNGWHGNKGAAGSSPDASAAPAKRGLGSWIKGNGWHGNKGAAAASPDASAPPAKREEKKEDNARPEHGRLAMREPSR